MLWGVQFEESQETRTGAGVAGAAADRLVIGACLHFASKRITAVTAHEQGNAVAEFDYCRYISLFAL